MITFKLLNYPEATTTWEVFLAERSREGEPRQDLQVPAREGDLVITLFRGIQPVWKWIGKSGIPDASMVEVSPKDGAAYLVRTSPAGGTSSRTPLLVLGLSGLALVATTGMRRR